MTGPSKLIDWARAKSAWITSRSRCSRSSKNPPRIDWSLDCHSGWGPYKLGTTGCLNLKRSRISSTATTGDRQQTIVVGHGYSTIAWVPESEGSWALPLLHERISSEVTPLQKAASQLRRVCTQIPASVLFLGDASRDGYCIQVQRTIKVREKFAIAAGF